jgi:hypothetical protein
VATPLSTTSGVTDLPRPTESPYQVVGVPGVAVYMGYLQDGEKDASLAGRNRYVTYSDVLANATTAAAGVRFFLNLVGKAEWTAEPADGSAEARRLADLVEGIFRGTGHGWRRVVRRAAMYRFYGFAILEWTMVRRPDGVVALDRVDARAQRTITRWDLDVESGDLNGVIQERPQDGKEVYLPRWKLVHLVDDALHDSPEGLGLFRHLVKAARRLERYELLEGWGYESDLRGVPIGRAPLRALEELVKAGKLDAAQAKAIRAGMEKFVTSHVKTPVLGVMLDSEPWRAGGEAQTPSSTYQWDVDLLKGEGGPHQFIAQAIERTNREIARVLGVEHLLLGSNDRGSYALSADKSNQFGMTVDSTLADVREAFERDLLGPLWELNGWDPRLKPTLATSQAQYRDVQQVTGALADMAKAGAPTLPDDPAVDEVRALIGLSPALKVTADLMSPDLPDEGLDEPPASDEPPTQTDRPSA